MASLSWRIVILNKVQLSKCCAALANAGSRQYSNGKQPSNSKTSEKPAKESYKCPEYFGHDKWTYAEYEIELIKHRLPQPYPYEKSKEKEVDRAESHESWSA